MSFIARHKLVAVVAIICGACSNAVGAPGTDGDVLGTWDVVLVNDSPLPALLPTHEGCALTGLSGTMDVRPNGNFSGVYRYQADCRFFEETIDRAISGRFTKNGADLIFAADSGFSRFTTAPLVAGSISGPLLTLRSTPAPGMTVTMTLQKR